VVLLAGAAFVVVAFAAYGFFLSSWLVVDRVEVEGAVTATAGEVLTAAQVDIGVPLARVDTDAVARRVRGLRPVESVELRRAWPDTLVITIDERDPALVVAGPDGFGVYDMTGVEFANPTASPAGVPVLRAADAALDSAVLDAVLAVVSDLPVALRARIAEVSAPTLDSIALHLADGVVVEWGSAENNSRKAQVLTKLMATPATVYNVSAPEVPAIRPLPSATP